MKLALRFRYVIFVALTCVVGLLWLLLPTHFESTDTYAARIVAECDDVQYRPMCYETSVPKLMDTGVSMEKAFDITRRIQVLDPTYRYCHVLAHELSAKETKKDLSKWKEVIARAPSGICGNGGLHGAFQERFRSDAMPYLTAQELSGQLRGVCDHRPGWNPTYLERASCMHGIGHLSMYVTDAALVKSIQMCEIIAHPDATEDFRRTCVDGVFMQVFQPLEPEDVGLVEHVAPKAAGRLAFCKKFSGLAYASCVKESWPLVRTELLKSQSLATFCDALSGGDKEYCMSGTMYVAFGMLEFDDVKMRALCSGMTGIPKQMCISYAAYRIVDTDWNESSKALAFCNAAPTDTKTACYEKLIDFAGMGFHTGTQEARALCSGMPVQWAESCATRAGIIL